MVIFNIRATVSSPEISKNTWNTLEVPVAIGFYGNGYVGSHLTAKSKTTPLTGWVIGCWKECLPQLITFPDKNCLKSLLLILYGEKARIRLSLRHADSLRR
jgi:hypothetical protein